MGSTIAARLLGKLLADLASMREESVATSAGIGGGGGGAEAEAGVGALALGEKRAPGERGGGGGGLADFNSLDARRFGDNSNGGAAADSSSLGGSAPPSRGGTGDPSRLASAADETGAEGGGDGGGAAAGSDGEGGVAGGEDDDGVLHRLCPTYAQDVNSPLRHVSAALFTYIRTYFFPFPSPLCPHFDPGSHRPPPAHRPPSPRRRARCGVARVCGREAGGEGVLQEGPWRDSVTAA